MMIDLITSPGITIRPLMTQTSYITELIDISNSEDNDQLSEGKISVFEDQGLNSKKRIIFFKIL